MKAWLYILRCADGSYYTGSTNNLSLRLAQHQAGEGSIYTRSRLPLKLVYTQEFPSEHEAFLRERQVKGWSRAKKAALIRGDFEALIGLSKSRASLYSNDCDPDSDLASLRVAKIVLSLRLERSTELTPRSRAEGLSKDGFCDPMIETRSQSSFDRLRMIAR